MTLGKDFVTDFECPYCRLRTPIQEIVLEQDIGNLDYFYHIGQCQNVKCKRYIMFVYKTHEDPRQIIRTSVTIPVDLIHHYPTISATTHDSVPPNIADSYKEGVNCLNSDCNKSAVLMFRRALQQICKNLNTTQRNLDDQINEVLPERLSEVAHEIRNWGNIGAHPDDLIDSVDREDATQMKELLELIFLDIYETPWKIQKSRDKRNSG